MVYISEITRPQSIIFEGPVAPGLNPRVLTSRNLEDLPENYWEFKLLARKLTEYPALRKNHLKAVERLNHYCPPGKILDLGCGWGFFLAAAREKGWEPFGIEPLPGHALYARSKLGLSVITDTLHPDTYREDFFDAITSFQVFEHLPDPGQVLEQLQSFQKSNGILLLEVPNIDTWSLRVLGKYHRHYNPDHINFFSKGTLTRFLNDHGYQVLETYTPRRYMTIHYLVNYWLRRFLPGKFVDFLLKSGGRGFYDYIVSLNLGDILGVIARKVNSA